MSLKEKTTNLNKKGETLIKDIINLPSGSSLIISKDMVSSDKEANSIVAYAKKHINRLALGIAIKVNVIRDVNLEFIEMKITKS